MVDYKCEGCGYVGCINFDIEGEGLINKFQVPKCKAKAVLFVEFFERSRSKIKIESKRIDYIG